MDQGENQGNAGDDGKEKGKGSAMVEAEEMGTQEDGVEKGSSSKEATARPETSDADADPEADAMKDASSDPKSSKTSLPGDLSQAGGSKDIEAASVDEVEYVDYRNGWPLTILSYAIWLVILAANGYLIVTLAL